MKKNIYRLFTVFLCTLPALTVRSQTAEDSIAVNDLNEITVSGFRPGTVISSSSLFKTETITHAGLTKMACCALSESFENSASANVAYSDAISGARQIQLLGLAGFYVQTLAENVPVLRGLASTYGWSHVPAPWLESIQISKGTSSVVNGYESVSGQINLEFKKPHLSETLYADYYVDELLHLESNITSSLQISDKLWTGLLLHGSSTLHPQDESLSAIHDRNNDQFLDMPKMQNINAYNRWFYLDEERGIQSRIGIRFLYETRDAGQDSTCHDAAAGIPLYESPIVNKNIQVYNKTGISTGKTGGSLGIISSFTLHDLHSAFGMKTFNGRQTSWYASVLYASGQNGGGHRYTAGASFSYDRYGTEFLDSLEFNQTPLTRFNRTEAVPGAFAEYTFSGVEKLTLVAGIRADCNSRYGWLFTPRANVKYDCNDYLILRVSGGRGFHSPGVIAENTGLLASSRKFDLSQIDALDMERAWNFGASAQVYVPLWDEGRATLSLEYFHTRFQNQAVADMERNRNAVYFYNLDGRSSADAWQTDLSLTVFRGFDVFAAFRYSSNRLTYTENGQRYEKEKPLVSSFKGLVNLSYATALKRWVFDVTAQLNGPARLPAMNGYRSQDRYSPSFPVYFAQVTKNSKRFDLYLGVENLSDYRQENPVVGWENPFQRDFDASMIWGPLAGRKIYLGFRLRLGKLM